MAIKLKKSKSKDEYSCISCNKRTNELYEISIGYVDMRICQKCMEKMWEKTNAIRNQEMEKELSWMME